MAMLNNQRIIISYDPTRPPKSIGNQFRSARCPAASPPKIHAALGSARGAVTARGSQEPWAGMEAIPPSLDWLVVSTPLKNDGVRQWEGLSHI